ncbi:hypothetical protein BDY17DRAFT_296180 [Neohortaea acidophila]|uniref:FAD-binding domain-containing protein n=1 Tax=Neohortaea acidophila TaxID=245834 RepID=A0A6A6PXH6_9PEZI|nr:uncharacterized protein BDY17DRAFT_296180 [Neohortaea acidophila]KAF2484715.1 hypothetical protein BDY17DRAFT_296180 [Neohortaea acidophila]
MAQPLKVLISGSGIAGSVFATNLLRAYPTAAITIVERSPALRLTGAAVDIRGSAVDIIKWMGVESEVRAHTTRESGMQLLHANGKPIATFGATGRSDVQALTSEYEIFRGALAKIFIERVRGRVKLVFDETVSSFEPSADGVAVTFTRSKQAETYDLLVAADGYNSHIRGLMLGTPPSAQVHEENAYVAYFTTKDDLLGGSDVATGISTTLGRAMYLRPTAASTSGTSVLLMKVNAKSDTAARDKLSTAVREGNESYKQLMEEMFADIGWRAPEVLREMRQSDDFYCSVFAQVRSPSIQSGRVVLLGDAGYLALGYGTSLAIIGGYVLAGELAKQALSSTAGEASSTQKEKISAALKAYEDLVLPFAKTQQGTSGLMQLVTPQTRLGVGVRNALFGLVSTLKLDRMGMAISAKLGFTEKKLAMPEYPWVE